MKRCTNTPFISPVVDQHYGVINVSWGHLLATGKDLVMVTGVSLDCSFQLEVESL